jgi:hypothetical protein
MKTTIQNHIDKNEEFWKEQGKRIDWVTPYTKVKDVSYHQEDFKIKWYYDGELNASVNCIDRHLDTNLIKQLSSGRVTIHLSQNIYLTNNYMKKFVN